MATSNYTPIYRRMRHPGAAGQKRIHQTMLLSRFRRSPCTKLSRHMPKSSAYAEVICRHESALRHRSNRLGRTVRTTEAARTSFKLLPNQSWLCNEAGGLDVYHNWSRLVLRRGKRLGSDCSRSSRTVRFDSPKAAFCGRIPSWRNGYGTLTNVLFSWLGSLSFNT
jgi:hypothetical protein